MPEMADARPANGLIGRGRDDLRFLICSSLGVGITTCSGAAFRFGTMFAELFYGECTCAFSYLHNFAR